MYCLGSLWFFGGFHLLHKRQSFDKRQQQKLKKIRPHLTAVQSCTIYNWSLFLDHFILFLYIAFCITYLLSWVNHICYRQYSFDDSYRSSKSVIEIRLILGRNKNEFYQQAKEKNAGKVIMPLISTQKCCLLHTLHSYSDPALSPAYGQCMHLPAGIFV